MIDLHLHTTASDGASSPADLVREAVAAGLTTIAVTDHDTVAGIPDVVAAAGDTLTIVPGIEITAVERGRDVHVLGYFVDLHSEELTATLARQRQDRQRRLVEILDRLERCGAPVEAEPLLARARAAGDKAIGRLLVAQALIDAGHAADIAEAFDRYLGPGQPAFVERMGRPAVEVVELIRRSGGVASMAHPGKTDRDDLLPGLVEAGLDAIEVFHPDHDAETTARYAALADRLNLVRTGGSDYHGPESRRAAFFGRISVPDDDYERLLARRRPR